MIIKRLHGYILKNFLKTFSATFFGAVFVLLIQFSVRYMDEMIGKGLDFSVILEFMFYVSLTLVPTALPLAILVGSLMTFGSFSEKLELLAMKAAGISLFRILKTLIILVAILSIGSYHFANRVLPESQVRMWTLLFSIRQKSPEVEIPAGAFYGGIPGRNLYVGKKDGQLLLDVAIYDYNDGFNKISIVRADTGLLRTTPDKQHFVLDLYSGESFDSNIGTDRGDDYSTIPPYRREQFRHKCVIIDYDANFNELSSDFLTRQYVSKNTEQLQQAVDSLTRDMDNIINYKKIEIVENIYMDQVFFPDGHPRLVAPQDIQASYDSLPLYQKGYILDACKQSIQDVRRQIIQCHADRQWIEGERNRHAIEKQKKYTLAIACFIFLFIGAPLGAIIKKGGMGMPLVVSILMFLFYYIIDNTGYKMARESIWPVWMGMWLSTAILFPLGITLTYMAATEYSPKSIEKIKALYKRLQKSRIFAKKIK